jgi:hypothetical protein
VVIKNEKITLLILTYFFGYMQSTNFLKFQYDYLVIFNIYIKLASILLIFGKISSFSDKKEIRFNHGDYF